MPKEVVVLKSTDDRVSLTVTLQSFKNLINSRRIFEDVKHLRKEIELAKKIKPRKYRSIFRSLQESEFNRADYGAHSIGKEVIYDYNQGSSTDYMMRDSNRHFHLLLFSRIFRSLVCAVIEFLSAHLHWANLSTNPNAVLFAVGNGIRPVVPDDCSSRMQ